MKVFLADDSEHFRKNLILSIEDIPGIEIVGEAGDGVLVLSAIKKLDPDVVLLDIQMPGNNGIRVLEKIKKGSSSPIVIMLTNYPYSQYRIKCSKLGADYFFDKSAEMEDVISLLGYLKQNSRFDNNQEHTAVHQL